MKRRKQEYMIDDLVQKVETYITLIGKIFSFCTRISFVTHTIIRVLILWYIYN